MNPPRLIIVGGLPGTGKSTLAVAVAKSLGAAYVRVDTIEQTLRDLKLSSDLGAAGYVVAYHLAAENLALGQSVVADSVNPIAVTRQAWRDVGQRSGADVVEVEVHCSDRLEHQRRVETRTVNIPTLTLPTWQQVLDREYEPWLKEGIQQPLRIDTAGQSVAQSQKLLLSMLRPGAQ